MITPLTSSSLTADSRYSNNMINYKQKPDDAFWTTLPLNIYISQVAIAALSGAIGKNTLETNGWTVKEIHDVNFPLTMAAGSATLCLATISGMIMLTDMVVRKKIGHNTAIFIIGLPFNAGMGACYALAGAGMQHLLSNNDAKAFVATAGAIGNTITYFTLLAACTRPCFHLSLNNFNSYIARIRLFAPALLLGKEITYSDAMSLYYMSAYRPANRCETILPLAAIYAANLLIAAASGFIGYSMLHANKWSADEINGIRFVESMAAGAAILSLVTMCSMGYVGELVRSRKISQNAGMFAIGIPLYSAMGALYGLTGAGMQNLLKNSENISFTALAGATGAAITYTTLALLMEGRNVLRRAYEPNPYPETPVARNKNCFLKMYDKVCFTKPLEQIAADGNNLQQGLLQPSARDNNLRQNVLRVG